VISDKIAYFLPRKPASNLENMQKKTDVNRYEQARDLRGYFSQQMFELQDVLKLLSQKEKFKYSTDYEYYMKHFDNPNDDFMVTLETICLGTYGYSKEEKIRKARKYYHFLLLDTILSCFTPTELRYSNAPELKLVLSYELPEPPPPRPISALDCRRRGYPSLIHINLPILMKCSTPRPNIHKRQTNADFYNAETFAELPDVSCLYTTSGYSN
jgi:hypothetical protein